MTFLSKVESKFDEMFGDTDHENPESSLLEEGFTNLLSDIKKDLQTIPKEELWPPFPTSATKGRADKKDREDSEFDADDASKVLKKSARRSDKQCRVGDKIHEVGDRWKDETTGRDMICILMNIPKEIQPRLQEADVTITSNEPAKRERSRPSVEPPRQNTEHPRKKQTQNKPKQGEQSKKTEIEKNAGIPKPIQVQEEISEVSEKQTNHTDQEDQVIKRLKTGNLESLEVPSRMSEPVPELPNCDVEKVTEKTLKNLEPENQAELIKEEIKPLDKESGLITDLDLKKHKVAKSVNSDTEMLEDMEDKSSTDVKGGSSYELVVDASHSQKEKEKIDTKTDQVSETLKPEVKIEIVEEPLVKAGKGTESEVVVLNPTVHSKADVPTPKDITTKNTEVITSENDVIVPTEERGTPIYTKETVIKRRKLFKTKESIETTERYNNKQ